MPGSCLLSPKHISPTGVCFCVCKEESDQGTRQSGIVHLPLSALEQFLWGYDFCLLRAAVRRPMQFHVGLLHTPVLCRVTEDPRTQMTSTRLTTILTKPRLDPYAFFHMMSNSWRVQNKGEKPHNGILLPAFLPSKVVCWILDILPAPSTWGVPFFFRRGVCALSHVCMLLWTPFCIPIHYFLLSVDWEVISSSSSRNRSAFV